MSHSFKTVIKWDDLRSPANATTQAGANPPTFTFFQNDIGVGGVGYAVAQAGGSSELRVSPSFLDADSNHNISMWFSTEDSGGSGYWLWHTGDFDYRVQLAGGQSIQINRNNESSPTLAASWFVGTRNHLSVNIYTSGGERFYEVFINGSLQDSFSEPGILQTGSSNSELNFGRRPVGSSQSFSGIMDDIRVFSGLPNAQPLKPSEVAQLYNGGAGTNAALNPDNATELARYPMDEGTGTVIDNAEGTASRDLTINSLGSSNFWVSGLIGGGSRGVFGYAFDPNVTQEVFFDVQIPHGYVQGSQLEPHVHWSPPSDGNPGECVCWGFEYTPSRVGGPWPNTVTLSGSQAAPSGVALSGMYHYVTKLGTIPGEVLAPDGVTIEPAPISTMLKCRLYRDTASPTDTYPEKAFLHEFDIHVQLSTRGSDEEFEKHGL